LTASPAIAEEDPVIVREENAADVEAVRAVNLAAFPGPDEANLVDALREDGVAVSLVAEVDGEIVGHLMLSRIAIGAAVDRAVALAPMSVRPARQRAGVGSALVEAAITWARGRGYDAIVVLGHPSYYPRFGFVPAAPHGIRCPYDAPDDAWMVLELSTGALAPLDGVVQYAPAFAASL
jgi:putative acetyltransferase